jgi:hypothetical protein
MLLDCDPYIFDSYHQENVINHAESVVSYMQIKKYKHDEFHIQALFSYRVFPEFVKIILTKPLNSHLS